MDWPAQEAKLSAILVRHHGRVIARALADASARLGRPVSGVVGDVRVRRLVGTLAARVPGMVATQREQLASLLEQHGDDPTRLAAALTEQMGMLPSRAETIAHTETSTGYNLATVYAAQASAVSRVYVSDGDGDPECSALDGTVQSVVWAEANPLGHPNCRRVFSLAIGEREAAA